MPRIVVDCPSEAQAAAQLGYKWERQDGVTETPGANDRRITLTPKVKEYDKDRILQDQDTIRSIVNRLLRWDANIEIEEIRKRRLI